MTASLERKVKDCLCGKRECRGITSAFLLLDDSRSGFTSLPQKSETDHEMNGLRNAYLRYMFPNAEHLEEIENELLLLDHDNNGDIQKKKKIYYVANHHFHPEIVKQSTQVVTKINSSGTSMRSLTDDDDATTSSTCRIFKTRIPMFISADDMSNMGIQSTMSDLVMDENGLPAGDHCYVVPNYSLHEARKDVGLEAKVRRLIHESRYMMMDDEESIACNSGEQLQTKNVEDITAAATITTTVKQKQELSLSQVPIETAASTASTDIPANSAKGPDLEEGQSLTMLSSSSISSKLVDGDDDESPLMVSNDGSLRGLTCAESMPQTTSNSETEESSYDDSFSSRPPHLSSAIIGDNSGSKSVDGGRRRTCTSILNELEKYEIQRRATNKENVHDEFQSMLQMLRHGIEECLQYEHLLHGMAAANQQYAMAMKSICTSYDKRAGGSSSSSSNNSGNAATAVAQSTKNGFKTLFQRGRNRNTNPSSPTRRSALKSTLDNEVSATNNNSKFNGSPSNVTSSLIHIHSALADELNEASNHISNDISKEMQHYREKLDYKVNHDVEKKGIDAIRLMDASESLVQKAWGAYYELAAENRRDHNNIHNNCGNSSLSSNSDASASVEASFPSCDAPRYTADLWVTELHYRAAVKMHLVAKQKWDSLRKEIAAIESERQMKVQEVLLSYLPRQRRAFSTFSELQKPILNNLMAQNHTSPGLKEVGDLKQGKSRPHDSPFSSAKQTTSSPLSPIVNGGTVMLVERKIGRDTWNNTLAVTSYSLLHLFHIPSTVSKIPSSSAVETFENLVAPLYASTAYNNKHESSSSGRGTTITQVLETLTPFQSFYLPECKIYMQDGCTEVEIDSADSFSRGFVQLRTSSQKEMSKLLDSNNISCRN